PHPMDPTGVVGLDRGHSAECHAGFRLSPEGLVHSIGRLDIEVTMDVSVLGPPPKYDLASGCRPASVYECSLVGRDTFQRQARTPFDRRFVVLIVGLIHHDGLQVDFLRRRLLAQIADGDLGAETALNESIVVAATEDITGL